jgi:hypothetical protein
MMATTAKHHAKAVIVSPLYAQAAKDALDAVGAEAARFNVTMVTLDLRARLWPPGAASGSKIE